MPQTKLLVIVLCIVLASVLALYMSTGTSQTDLTSASLMQQHEIAELKKQVAGLQEKLNWLEERFTEPHREKLTQF